MQVAIVVSCQMAFSRRLAFQESTLASPLTTIAVLFGYDQGVFSGIVGNEDWKTTFGQPGSALEGIIVSIYNLGAFSGCILTFLVGEKLGRRLCMWIAMVWIVCKTYARKYSRRFC